MGCDYPRSLHLSVEEGNREGACLALVFTCWMTAYQEQHSMTLETDRHEDLEKVSLPL